MDNALPDRLSQTMAQTVEDLTFIFATPDRWVDPLLSGREIGMGVAFNGQFKGELVFICPPAAGRQMAINMLGLEDDDPLPGAQVHDALQEVINIICGNILPVLAGDQAVFNILTPKILDSPTREDLDRSVAQTFRIKLDLEGHPGYLFIFIDDFISGESA